MLSKEAIQKKLLEIEVSPGIYSRYDTGVAVGEWINQQYRPLLEALQEFINAEYTAEEAQGKYENVLLELKKLKDTQ